jgi:hypothetical protein
LQIKRVFDGENVDPLEVGIFMDNAPECKIKGGLLALNKEEVLDIFNPVVDKIIESCEQLCEMHQVQVREKMPIYLLC